MTTYHRPFKAIRTVHNGISYASKAEARRAAELDLLQRAGKVIWWIPQVTVALGCPENRYRIDFLVAEPLDWRHSQAHEETRSVLIHAEDVKAIETREFARNKRLWAKYGPFDLHIIKKGIIEIVRPGVNAEGVL